jgi:hypothetical protein
MHNAEQFVPQPSTSEVAVAIGNPKSCKSSGTDQIRAELIERGE